MFNCIIMGAAGRDFHDFQTFFVAYPAFRVRAFTATQIPFIASRSFPRELAGPAYDSDIPIYDESELARLIDELDIDFVFFAYSDISHRELMHRASLVQADFVAVPAQEDREQRANWAAARYRKPVPRHRPSPIPGVRASPCRR